MLEKFVEDLQKNSWRNSEKLLMKILKDFLSYSWKNSVKILEGMPGAILKGFLEKGTPDGLLEEIRRNSREIPAETEEKL